MRFLFLAVFLVAAGASANSFNVFLLDDSAGLPSGASVINDRLSSAGWKIISGPGTPGANDHPRPFFWREGVQMVDPVSGKVFWNYTVTDINNRNRFVGTVQNSLQGGGSEVMVVDGSQEPFVARSLGNFGYLNAGAAAINLSGDIVGSLNGGYVGLFLPQTAFYLGPNLAGSYVDAAGNTDVSNFTTLQSLPQSGHTGSVATGVSNGRGGVPTIIGMSYVQQVISGQFYAEGVPVVWENPWAPPKALAGFAIVPRPHEMRLPTAISPERQMIGGDIFHLSQVPPYAPDPVLTQGVYWKPANNGSGYRMFVLPALEGFGGSSVLDVSDSGLIAGYYRRWVKVDGFPRVDLQPFVADTEGTVVLINESLNGNPEGQIVTGVGQLNRHGHLSATVYEPSLGARAAVLAPADAVTAEEPILLGTKDGSRRFRARIHRTDQGSPAGPATLWVGSRPDFRPLSSVLDQCLAVPGAVLGLSGDPEDEEGPRPQVEVRNWGTRPYLDIDFELSLGAADSFVIQAVFPGTCEVSNTARYSSD